MSVEHELKTWPALFEEVYSGAKPFEVRKADRPFARGDTLLLREWVPVQDRYTGRAVRRRVTFVLAGGQFGIGADHVVLGLGQMDVATAELVRQAEELRGTSAVLVNGYGRPFAVQPNLAAWEAFVGALAKVEAARPVVELLEVPAHG